MSTREAAELIEPVKRRPAITLVEVLGSQIRQLLLADTTRSTQHDLGRDEVVALVGEEVFTRQGPGGEETLLKIFIAEYETTLSPLICIGLYWHKLNTLN